MSSLLCLTLWKSYLFSWRTKLAKLLCLKCFGRMALVNFSFWKWSETAHHDEQRSKGNHTSSTTKLSPSSPHRTTCEYEGSSSILRFLSAICQWKMLNISARHTCTVSAPAKRQRMVSRSMEGHEDAYEIARTARAGSAARLATVHNAAHDHNLMSRSGSEKRATRPMAVQISEVDVFVTLRQRYRGVEDSAVTGD